VWTPHAGGISVTILDSVAQPGLLLNLVLPIVGVGIICFCIASFFLPFGQRFKASKQVIRGFGLDLEISVLTLLLLMGFAMAFAGVYLQLQNRMAAGLNDEIKRLQGQVEENREQLRLAGRFMVRADLVLPGNSHITVEDIGKLECRYVLSAKPDSWLQAGVSRGLASNSIRITLADIDRDDVIQQIELRKQGSSRVLGMARNIYPLQPMIALQPPD